MAPSPSPPPTPGDDVPVSALSRGRLVDVLTDTVGDLERLELPLTVEGVEEARAAALSADAQVSNDHDTNIRDDLDRAIATVHAVSDQIGELTGHVGTLADQLGRVETTLSNHGKSLEAVESRVGRIDERGGRMAEEIHDERVARESAQRTIDEHSHDAHARLHERLDRLEERMNEQ